MPRHFAGRIPYTEHRLGDPLNDGVRIWVVGAHATCAEKLAAAHPAALILFVPTSKSAITAPCFKKIRRLALPLPTTPSLAPYETTREGHLAWYMGATYGQAGDAIFNPLRRAPAS